MVASFYLPVTLTKRTVPSSGHDADPEDCDGWIADWDHEQLIALQVRDDYCLSAFRARRDCYGIARSVTFSCFVFLEI